MGVNGMCKPTQMVMTNQLSVNVTNSSLHDNNVTNNNNNNNNNIVICKAQKVSSNAESEAPVVARWAALVGYAKRLS